MAIVNRSIVSALIVASFFFLPGFASAQDVYEVHTSSDEYVVVGAHPGATMDQVVTLARRLTGNTALTSEDVLANLPHARRYVCRHNGRMTYFGTDPEYGGNCPEGASRSHGIIAGARYRVPRTHGTILAPRATRRTSRVARTTADAADVEARVLAALRDLERVTEERDEARERYAASETAINQADDAREQAEAALEAHLMADREAEILADEARIALEAERDEALRQHGEATAEIERLRAELASRPTSTIVAVGAPGERERIAALEAEAERMREENARLERELAAARTGGVTLESRLEGRPIWGWALLIILLMIALFFVLYGLVIRPRTLAPHLAYREVLESKKTELEGDVMEKKVVIDELKKDMQKKWRRFASVRAAGKRALKIAKTYVTLHAGLVEDEERASKKLITYQARKERIAANAAKLAELRDQEEVFLNAEDLLQEAMEALEDAQARDDADAIRDHGVLVETYTENLQSLGDPGSLRAEIAGLVETLRKDLQDQAGITYDTRPADERLGEWEARRRDSLRKAEAKHRVYGDLVALAERQAMEGLESLAQRRRELENMFEAKDGAMLGRLFGLAAARSDAESHLKSNERTFTRMRAQIAQLIEEKASLTAALLDAGGGMVGALEPESPDISGPRKRMPTQGMAAIRDSQLPGPPSSPLAALNRDIYKFLDTLRSIPQDDWIIQCDESAARDWAFLLHNCYISTPGIGTVLLRKYVPAVKERAPDWLTNRVRKPTIPPGAMPATG